MLAAHDQENRLFSRSLGGASGKQQALQPKTPGAKYLKTPLKKMPFDDQNGGTRMAGGRSVMGGRHGGGIENMQQTVRKAGKAACLATPNEPRTARAPLGNKTTNAKAQTLHQHQQQQLQKQALGVKERVREIEKSAQQAQPTTAARRARVISPRANSSKLSVLSDGTAGGAGGGRDDDIEYAPPPVSARPYESDVFPDGALSFAAFQPANRLRGYYDHYYNPVDANGLSRRDKELADKQRLAFEKLDISVQDDLDSLDWSISDLPASKGFVSRRRAVQAQPAQVAQPAQAAPLADQGPATIKARKAAAALALGAKSSAPQSAVGRLMGGRTNTTTTATTTKPGFSKKTAASASSASSTFLSGLPLRGGAPAKPGLVYRPKENSHLAAGSASRTTLGYTKGRSALSLVRGTSVAERPAAGRPASAARPRTAMGANDSRAASVSTAVTPARSMQKMQADTGLLEASSNIDGDSDDNDDGSARIPAFVSIFNVDEEESDDLGGAGTVINDDLDDEFQLDVHF